MHRRFVTQALSGGVGIILVVREHFRPSLLHGILGHGYEVCKDSTLVEKSVKL